MLQSGLIMKWKTVIIYLQTAFLSSHMTPLSDVLAGRERVHCQRPGRHQPHRHRHGVRHAGQRRVQGVQGGAVQGVATNTVQGSFALLVAGILLSFAVLAVELCCSKGTGGSKAGLGNTFSP